MTQHLNFDEFLQILHTQKYNYKDILIKTRIGIKLKSWVVFQSLIDEYLTMQNISKT